MNQVLLLPQVAQSAQAQREQEIERLKDQWNEMQSQIKHVMAEVANVMGLSWQAITDAMQSVLAVFAKKKRYSPQSRAFLAVKQRHRQFTPHAHRRRASSRRLQVRERKAFR